MKRTAWFFGILAFCALFAVDRAFPEENLATVVKSTRRSIEFSLPRQATNISFEVVFEYRSICALTYRPGSISLNGKVVWEMDSRYVDGVVSYHGPAQGLLLVGKNKIVFDPGSCANGFDRLEAVRKLRVYNDSVATVN
jgi:hypothetical protein